jgi:hypothetical protein
MHEAETAERLEVEMRATTLHSEILLRVANSLAYKATALSEQLVGKQ